MAIKQKRTGGGWAAIRYSLRLAGRAGYWKTWKAMQSKNACKTCAVGMGGSSGGMRNEAGHWPEVCKKSFQAMVADMQGAIRPEFFAKYGVAELRTLSPRELENCGRIATPLLLKPGGTHYQPISWDEALGKLAAGLRGAPAEKSFFYMSGRSSNEAAFLTQLFARMHGTNHVTNCSFYCHQASGVGLGRTLGAGTATVTLEDLDQADFFMLIGGNPASNHPRLMRTLMQLRRRGGQVVVVNPLKEVGLVNFSVPSDVRSLLFGTPIATQYVQPHAGGDLAFLTGLAKDVLENQAENDAFLSCATEGYAAFRGAVLSLGWDEIVAKSGVAEAELRAVGAAYRKSKSAVFGWTMGITHHLHGVRSVEAIVALALLRGMVGRPGAGLLPIRGHSNVQGIGSMGVTPALKDAVFQRLKDAFGVAPPSWPGKDTLATLQACERGEFAVGLALGGNLFGANPDARWATKAFAGLPLLAYVSTTLNTGHAWGLAKETLILPALARDEEPEPTTQESMFNFVRISAGGPARHEGPRSEIALVAELAERVLGGAGGPVDWPALRHPKNLRTAIGKVVPGYEELPKVDAEGKEFHVAGRALHAARFPTESGRAKFAVPELPELRGEPGQFRLMTLRSEGQFNSVVYEEEDIYRGQERRDVVLMHADDIAALGVQPDDEVTVRNAVGELTVRARPFDVRRGNIAMYYPEANVLVPQAHDPLSKTPAFKCVVVDVVRAEAVPAGFMPAAALTAAR